jgi:SAM-dependent methyltransferase
VTSDDPRRRTNALARQLERYYVRFNAAFWAFFGAEVELRLPATPVLVDLGCGPGLFLRDVSKRLPAARLHGYDAADDMLENARGLDYAGEPPTLARHDVSRDLPLADGSVDLLTIAAVMHTFEDPFAFLEEARRVIVPNGLLLIYDWVRVPFQEYIANRESEPGDPLELRRPRALQLFTAHNKYTEDDWRWILAEARYDIVTVATPYPRVRAFLVRAG